MVDAHRLEIHYVVCTVTQLVVQVRQLDRQVLLARFQTFQHLA